MNCPMALGTLSPATVVALGAGQAVAITNGDMDGDGHPYVGLMVAKNSAGTPLWRCSGTLLTPALFLTAGHCTQGPAASAEIWFRADLQTDAAAKGCPFTCQARGTT